MSVPRRLSRSSLESIGAKIRERRRLRRGDLAVRITVHRGSEATDHLAQEVHDTLVVSCLRSGRRDVHIAISGGFGPRSEEILVTVESAFVEPVTYGRTDAKVARDIFLRHVMHGEILGSQAWILGLPEKGDAPRSSASSARESSVPRAAELPFFTLQQPWTLRRRGRVDPASLEDALAHDAYLGLARAIFDLSPGEVLTEVERAGILEAEELETPVSERWRSCVADSSAPPVIVCCGDTPGEQIFRGIIESDPHAVLEGMAIAARATGAHQGLLVCPGLPFAAERLENAVVQAQGLGLLGEGILGSELGITVSVVTDADALDACETEGGKKTLRHSAETFAALGALLHLGAESYQRLGVPGCPGTKLLTLGGRFRYGGLVEVPFGLPLRRLVEELGGGLPDGGRPKAIHLGGMDGALLPEPRLDLPFTPTMLRKAGLSPGNGSLLLLSEEDDLLELCRLLLGLRWTGHATQCPPCHAGTLRLMRLLDRLLAGAASDDDLLRLEEVARALSQEKECPRCRALPTTLLGALEHFRPEIVGRLKQPTAAPSAHPERRATNTGGAMGP